MRLPTLDNKPLKSYRDVGNVAVKPDDRRLPVKRKNRGILVRLEGCRVLVELQGTEVSCSNI